MRIITSAFRPFDSAPAALRSGRTAPNSGHPEPFGVLRTGFGAVPKSKDDS
jgi:hypothetical protein